MNGIEALLILPLWAVLVIGAWLVEFNHAHRAPGAALQIAAWLTLTAVTLAYGSVLLFVTCNFLLFTFGKGVAAVALIVSELLLIGIPVIWWLGVRTVVHHIEARYGHAPRKR